MDKTGLSIAMLCTTLYSGQMFLCEQDEEFIKKSPNLFLDKYGNQYRLFSGADNMRGYRFDQVIVVDFQIDRKLFEYVLMSIYGDIIPEKYKVQYVS